MSGGAGRSATRAQRRRTFTRRRRRRRIVWSGAAIAIVLVVLAGSAAGYLYYLDHQIKRLSVNHLSAAATSGAGAGTENVLLVGSTSRCALKVQHLAYGLCSAGVTGVNSDVVMILHLDSNTGTASILSIPRDLFVPNARSTGAGKIDAALVQGPSQLVAAVEEDFGIPIQHYVELNFESFAGVVNALGGVKMYFPMPLFDAESGLNIQTAGCHQLNGVHALALVRARHLQYRPANVSPFDTFAWPQDPESDLSRIRRDHEFLEVLASAVAKQGLGDLATDQHVLASVAPQLAVDRGLSLSDMAHLVLTFHNVSPTKTPQLTIPVVVLNGSSYSYEGHNEGSVEFPDNPLDRQVIDQFLHSAPTAPTSPSPASIAVGVVDGTDTNQAASTAAQLGALGYNVVGTSRATPVGPVAETVVYYANPQAEPDAQAVTNSMSGGVIMGLGPTLPGSDVTVVTGSDSTVDPAGMNPAASPATVAPSATVAAASTPGAPAASSGLGTPTAAVQPLASFDPRSCTSSGKEGP